MKPKTSSRTRSLTVKSRSKTAGLRRVLGKLREGQAPLIAKLAGVSSTGEALVLLPHAKQPVAAQSTVAISGRQVGRDVLVSITSGDNPVVVVIGVLQQTQSATDEATSQPQAHLLDVEIDRERITLTARRELVLRCGKASIALGADGKVVIKGSNLLSAAAGLHRIRGAAVQIN